MKRILENFKKLTEGDVIPFPGQEKNSSPFPNVADAVKFQKRKPAPEQKQPTATQLTIDIEDMISNYLDNVYGSSNNWPIEKIEALEQIADQIEALLLS